MTCTAAVGQHRRKLTSSAAQIDHGIVSRQQIDITGGLNLQDVVRIPAESSFERDIIEQNRHRVVGPGISILDSSVDSPFCQPRGAS